MTRYELQIALAILLTFFSVFSYAVCRLDCPRPWKMVAIIFVGGVLAMWLLSGYYLYARLAQ